MIHHGKCKTFEYLLIDSINISSLWWSSGFCIRTGSYIYISVGHDLISNCPIESFTCILQSTRYIKSHIENRERGLRFVKIKQEAHIWSSEYQRLFTDFQQLHHRINKKQQWHRKAALQSLNTIAINVLYIDRVEDNAHSLYWLIWPHPSIGTPAIWVQFWVTQMTSNYQIPCSSLSEYNIISMVWSGSL